MHLEKILGSARRTSTGGRTGMSTIPERCSEHRARHFARVGRPGGSGTNPEQLFATGYSPCFLSAMKHVAMQKKGKRPEESTVTAQVGIGPRAEGQGFGLDVALRVSLPRVDRETARAVVEQAHSVALTAMPPATTSMCAWSSSEAIVPMISTTPERGEPPVSRGLTSRTWTVN
jgi:lipoyl-dependent peroxiredoxin